MAVFDLLLQGGTVVDPANGINGRRDLAIRGPEIAEVAEEIDPSRASRVINLAGKVVIPGIIDTHVHVCRPFGGTHGFKMLARAGVTTAIDFAGYGEAIADGMLTGGHGLNIGYVGPIIPGETVPDRDPDLQTVRDLAARVLGEGALGLKVLGGHYPLTPEATARAIRVGTENGVYVAFHAGTTATGSNMNGVLEAIELAAGNRLHLAHVNSYCRGQVTGDPLEEAARVLAALRANRNVVSESYLAAINGAVATCAEGVPTSNVVKTCLRQGGFPPTQEGLVAAIQAGWGKINRVVDGEAVLLPPDEGLDYFGEMATKVGISFPVNSAGAAIAIAINKQNGFQGPFTVTAISTDGGAYPRNTIVSQGLPLVRFGCLTLEEFVIKTSVSPAAMLGLPAKGHLAPGADADVTVVDLLRCEPVLAVARGQVTLEEGRAGATGGCLLTMEAGTAFARSRGLTHHVIRSN